MKKVGVLNGLKIVTLERRMPVSKSILMKSQFQSTCDCSLCFELRLKIQAKQNNNQRCLQTQNRINKVKSLQKWDKLTFSQKFSAL